MSVRIVKSPGRANFPWAVQFKPTENWSTTAAYADKGPAVEHAERLQAEYPHLPVRVQHYAGGPSA